ncbi:3-ketoacyl-CoA synthase 11 [Sesamum angolense]|uniref:very-long-chain 3-oxoacyl-CoA synthase n=1 Tax=Sesamum angolense TaxID=2727404 RepID=A0AAE1T732_9LAMI|nr:3-ketoacyl-CoA synthase 11 [Sesamum angolense]
MMLPLKLNFLITHPHLTFIVLLLSTLTLFLFQFFAAKSRRRVFLVDFACYKPPESQKCSRESVVNRARQHGYSEENLNFMAKVMQRVGVGDSSYVAQSIMCVPPNVTTEAAREESESVIFGAVDTLLAKTKVDCSEIGILIVNCCVFSVFPSLSSVIVNRYKLREDISSYNITGMGCSAGLRVIGLAKQLLEVHPNTFALVVSTENVTSSAYTGTERSKMLANCLFRIGGSAILLSNKPSHRESSKYELLHAVHTQTASSDVSYRSIFRDEDAEGYTGGKPVLDALQKNLGFTDAHMEASTMTLHRFGNTSSSSVWYELAYVEAKDRVKKGGRIWHIAFGSGFKCSTVIWRALMDVRADEKNPWMSDIDDYPVELDNDGSFPFYFQPAKQQ